jgi:DNA-binding CsgD family transcriptional regulator
MTRSDRNDRRKLGDVAAGLRGRGDAAVKRELVAAWCKMALPSSVAGTPLEGRPPAGVAGGDAMAPRMRQTLQHLLTGDSEKQIASKLAISQHTVHVYVKRLYRHYGVSSRGELLARFVAGGGGGG